MDIECDGGDKDHDENPPEDLNEIIVSRANVDGNDSHQEMMNLHSGRLLYYDVSVSVICVPISYNICDYKFIFLLIFELLDNGHRMW